MIKMSKLKYQMSKFKKGVAFLLTMLLVAIVSTIALAVGRLMVSELRMTTSLEESTAAYFAAEAGIEDGLLRLKSDRDIEVPTAPATLERKNITDPSRNVNPLASDKYYELKIFRTAARIGDPANLDSSPQLFKDDVFEISSRQNATTLNLDYKVYNAQVDTSRRLNYGVEIIRIDIGGGITRWFCPDRTAVANGVEAQGSCTPDISDEYTYHVWGIPFDATIVKVRIKPWGYGDNFHIRYAVTPLPAGSQIEQNFTTVQSTGYFGKTKRTLQAKVDRGTGQIISLFDFTVFQGGQ